MKTFTNCWIGLIALLLIIPAFISVKEINWLSQSYGYILLTVASIGAAVKIITAQTSILDKICWLFIVNVILFNPLTFYLIRLALMNAER